MRLTGCFLEAPHRWEGNGGAEGAAACSGVLLYRQAGGAITANLALGAWKKDHNEM